MSRTLCASYSNPSRIPPAFAWALATPFVIICNGPGAPHHHICRAAGTGTILLSGAPWPIASFGSPGAHSLSVGTRTTWPGGGRHAPMMPIRSADAASLLPTIRGTLRDLDPALPLDLRTARAEFTERLSIRRFQAGWKTKLETRGLIDRGARPQESSSHAPPDRLRWACARIPPRPSNPAFGHPIRTTRSSSLPRGPGSGHPHVAWVAALR